jgi:hypothetical protein
MQNTGGNIINWIQNNIDWLLSGIVPSTIIFWIERSKNRKLQDENIRLETKLEVNQKFQQNQTMNLSIDVYNPDMKKWIEETNSNSTNKISEEQIETFLSITKEIEKRIEDNIHSQSNEWLIKNKNLLVEIAQDNINKVTYFWNVEKRKSFVKLFLQHLDIASGLIKMNSGLPKGFELPKEIHSVEGSIFSRTYSEILNKIESDDNLSKGEKNSLIRIFNDFRESIHED